MKTFKTDRLVSIKDVAHAAGVSHSTVSRALQGSSLVKAETATKIRCKAEEMGYKASAVARGLVTRKTRMLGVLVTAITDPFNAEVVSGIQEKAHEHGYCMILANVQADPDRVITVVRSFQEQRVDAILVTASRVGALYVPLISEMQVPIVLVNNQHDSELVHSIMIENEEAVRAATYYLIEMGHRRIAFIGDRLGFQSNIERFTGYQRALVETGLPLRPELLVHGDGRPKAAARAIKTLMTLPEHPTAVICYNDMSAMGVLHGARQIETRVPETLSVVGFDDLYFASYLYPPLTTIRQPKRTMGRTAAQLALDLLAGKKIEKITRIKGELVVRSSTAPPGVHT